MKKYAAPRAALALLALSLAPAALRAQKAVFVVRHGEKTSDSKELLTEAGRDRARRLAALLKDTGVTAIYSTDTERTRDTVQPLADALGVKVALYDTGASMAGRVDAQPFVERLRREHPRDVVLIVGHSNTIPNLLETLGCEEKVTLASNEYDNLFVVVPRAGGTATLLRLRY
ncbi:MAG: SixA phosphatase family protein [Syntrophomonadaceae bacterium]